MPRVFNLAPFTTTALRLGEPEQAAEWIDLPCTLSELAQRVSGAVGEVDAIKAVPDPWAYPRTFADALTTEKHPLQGAFLDQWRGMLALFAFAREFEDRYHLSFSTLRMNGADRFDTVFRELKPAIALHETLKQLWLEPVVIRIGIGAAKDLNAPAKAETIGLLSPASLVSTGWATHKVRIAAIPWMENGLSDPLKLEGEQSLSHLQMQVLRSYLEKTLEALDAVLGAQPTEQSDWASIRAHLVSYRDACTGEETERTCEEDPRAGEGPQGVPLYEALWHPMKLGIAPESECLIKTRKEGWAFPFKGVILADSSLVATFNRRGADDAGKIGRRAAKDIHVWRNHTLRDVAQSPALFNKIQAEAGAAGYLLVRPDDFFAPCMAELKDAAISRHGALAGAVLPLSPLALFVCPPSEFATRVRSEGGQIVFDLELAVGKHGITKAFTGDDLVKDVTWVAPNIGLWPDFADARWQHYFARFMFSKVPPKELRPELATSAEMLADALRGGKGASDGAPARDESPAAAGGPASAEAPSDPDEAPRQFLLWCAGRVGAGAHGTLPQLHLQDEPDEGQPVINEPYLRRATYTHTGSRIIMQTSPKAYEAVLCEVIAEAGGSPRQVGLLILPPPVPRTDRAGRTTVEVSIDFGTTATVAYARFDGEESGFKVTFADRVLEPIQSKNLQKRAFQSGFIEFLPAEPHVPPISTAWFPNDFVTRASDAIVLKGVILFQPGGGVSKDAEPEQVEAWVGIVDKTLFDLKWDGELDEERRRFLRQFIVMVAAELFAAGVALDGIKWHFSYPQALNRAQDAGFGQNQVTEFEEMVTKIVHEAAGVSPQLVKLHLESEAAANFIVEQGADQAGPFGDYSVVLDIGGGTTDALICKGRSAIWSGSYRLAGMHFFTSSLLENRALLTGLGLPSWAKVLEMSARKDFALELLFSGNLLDSAFDERWNSVLSKEKTAADRLLGATFLYLGGLAYYLGLVCRDLPELAGQKKVHSVGFGLCGRGARFPIRLMGSDPESSHAGRALELFTIAAQPHRFATPLRIKMSNEAKLEVVKGMIDPGALTIDLKRLTGSESPHILPVTANLKRSAIKVRVPRWDGGEADGPPNFSISDPTIFLDFLMALEDHVGIKVGPRDYIGECLRTNAFVPKDMRDLVSQPAFLVALRWLVKAVASGRDAVNQKVAAKIKVEIRGR